MRLRDESSATFARGMQDSAAATAYRADECALLVNGRVSPEGTAKARRGSKRTHAAPLNLAGQGYGGTEYVTPAGVVQWLAFAGAKAFVSTNEGATWTEIAALLHPDYWSFARVRIAGKLVLVAANGGASVYAWDGTTWAALAGMPAGVRHVAGFSRRLWIAGHDGITLQASEIDVPTNLDTTLGALYIPIYDGEGELITGLHELGGRLLIFKRGSTAVLDGFGNDDLQVQAGSRGVSNSVGCIAHRTIQGVGDDGVMWLSERGLELFTTGNGLQPVATGLRRFFEEINWSAIAGNPGLPCALYLPSLNEYRCALPTYTAINDRTVRVSTARGPTFGAAYLDSHAPRTGGTAYVDDDGALAYEATPTRYQVRIVDGAFTLATDGRAGSFVTLGAGDVLELVDNLTEPAALFTADVGGEVSQPVAIGYDGFVRLLETGTTDDADVNGTNGREVAFRLRTRPLLFGTPFVRKRARLLHLSVEADDGATIYAAALGDGLPGSTHTLTIPAAAGRQPRQARARVGAKGRTLQVEVWTADAAAIAGFSLQGEVLREVGA